MLWYEYLDYSYIFRYLTLDQLEMYFYLLVLPNIIGI